MIEEELKNRRPIIYNGHSVDGGHSFVLDGADGNGYYHFNWGWGGVSDGYFSINLLNPEEQGAGGALGGYNYSQDGMFGVQKPTGVTPPVEINNLLQYGSTVATLSGNNIKFSTTGYNLSGWAPSTLGHVNVFTGMILTPMAGGKAMEVVSDNRIALDFGYYIDAKRSPITVGIPGGLADGEYVATVATKDATIADAKMYPVDVYYGQINYCILKVEKGQYSIIDVAAPKLEFVDVKVPPL